MSDVEQSEAGNRIIMMNDGSKVNFGKRAQVKTTVDADDGSLTFRVATGETIVFKANNVENLTPEQLLIHLYGVMCKIKSNLAPVKLQEDIYRDEEVDGKTVQVPTGQKRNSLAEAIQKNIAEILAGKFNIRGSGVEEEEFGLSDDQRLFAIAACKYADDVPFAHPEWSNLEDENTVQAIIELWDNMTAQERKAIRKNPFVVLEKSMEEIAKLKKK